MNSHFDEGHQSNADSITIWIKQSIAVQSSITIDGIIHETYTPSEKPYSAEFEEDIEEKENDDNALSEIQKRTDVLDINLKFHNFQDSIQQQKEEYFELAEKESSAPVKSLLSEAVEPIVEIPLSFEHLSSMDGITEYWKYKDISNIILKPQVFQQHILDRNYVKLHSVHFKFSKNASCPKSPTEKMMQNHQLMFNQEMKSNALKYRYMRISKYENPHNVSVLCRMCPHKKWIFLKHFKDHMSLAHGIVSVGNYRSRPSSKNDTEDIVVLPLPLAIYKACPRSMRRYHSQCPKCLKWIRLGLPESYSNNMNIMKVDDGDRLRLDNSTGEAYDDDISKMKRGLFTEYFLHFMACSRIQ